MIIAEIAQAHDGSLGNAHAYIDALADTGVDAVKFQTHIADAESSIHEPFRIKFSRQDTTRMDYWRRMEFTLPQWKELISHAESKGMELISSPFSNLAVDWLEEIGVRRYKIGSGEVSNLLMLEKICKTGKPIILSSGMSSWEELDRTVEFIQGFGNPLSILQCTTAYPTSPSQWGLNVIPELKERYQIPVGFSDHSGDIFACLAAAALGAEIFEFHVVFDKRMFGPDTPASVTIDQAKQMVSGIDQIRDSIKHPVVKSDTSSFDRLKQIFEKSLAVNKNLKAGEAIVMENLESKKPSGLGIPASDFRKVLGRKLKTDLNQWDFLNWEDLD
ncbi:N-acetylneuraminate synthase family protein [Algoriphagus sediminis]|uniref:N-acetylneuraminate synthase family protein n=1 Tax=Algoriphagus sediminis TaxID=3057113 RepID=A0ABT7YDZ1_9BACT|nr:N-acetylneuraminate synthase family protein [Algoriphagus sediminis]MDN3204745.1 N-acetylneuraminate synthase family protein [Algoriphagus sediminis]